MYIPPSRTSVHWHGSATDIIHRLLFSDFGSDPRPTKQTFPSKRKIRNPSIETKLSLILKLGFFHETFCGLRLFKEGRFAASKLQVFAKINCSKINFIHKDFQRDLNTVFYIRTRALHIIIQNLPVLNAVWTEIHKTRWILFMQEGTNMLLDSNEFQSVRSCNMDRRFLNYESKNPPAEWLTL